MRGEMNGYVSTWLFVAAGLTLAACETLSSNVLETHALQKNALSSELRNETTLVATLPAGCLPVTTTLPTGKTEITVSYREPTTDQNGVPLSELGYTTIYVTSAKGPAQAIRVWTNDAHGGAHVTIEDVPVPAQEVGICVTATNWARKESPPALPTKTKP
jgi:hypothetical protein